MLRRALLLEDAPTCIRVALAELRRAGYDPIVHRRGVRGARAACLVRFELYLVDVQVWLTEGGGEGSGLAFARWLRELRPEARIVIWTGRDGLEETQGIGAAVVVKGDADGLRAAIGVG